MKTPLQKLEIHPLNKDTVINFGMPLQGHTPPMKSFSIRTSPSTKEKEDLYNIYEKEEDSESNILNYSAFGDSALTIYCEKQPIGLLDVYTTINGSDIFLEDLAPEEIEAENLLNTVVVKIYVDAIFLLKNYRNQGIGNRISIAIANSVMDEMIAIWIAYNQKITFDVQVEAEYESSAGERFCTQLNDNLQLLLDYSKLKFKLALLGTF